MRSFVSEKFDLYLGGEKWSGRQQVRDASDRSSRGIPASDMGVIVVNISSNLSLCSYKIYNQKKATCFVGVIPTFQ